ETAVSILLNFRGPSLTVSHGGSSFVSAAVTAANWLSCGMCSYVLLGAADEIHPVIDKEYGRKAGEGECAAFFLLTLEETENEFIIGDLETDNCNPSFAAFNLAKKYEPLVNCKDVKKMISDYIKTTLAGNRREIISVFDSSPLPSFAPNISDEDKKKIYGGLKLMCLAGEDFPLNDGNMENVCLNSLNKKRKINFFTSGSSGLPKSCVHTLEMIKEEACGVSFLFDKIKRVAGTVPTYHSYGFIFSLQMPKYLNLPVVYYPPVPFFEWSKVLREGDLLVTFPLFLKYFIDAEFEFPPGVTILSSTAPCPDAVIDELYKRGAARLIEIYGSSENGAIGFREKSGAPFSLLPFWNCQENNGIVESISRQKTDFTGELQDIARVTGERLFSVEGRKDYAVQVAGVNVFPPKVENLIKMHPDVKDVMVRLGGERLKAFIVLKDGADLKKSQDSLRKYMETVLTPHEFPKNITFGEKLPATIFGKKADW
ncbi:MAG: AMP-binding protein, partial [Endomicrobia bacterium]|nr:AMP-binding protein [Endomicrobiia bacterium]